MTRPTIFNIAVIEITSFGDVDYFYGEDGLDNYEDCHEVTLAEATVEGSLDDAFRALRDTLAAVAPGRAWHFNGEFVSTSAKSASVDRIDVLITDGTPGKNFSTWFFSTLDVPKAEIDRLVGSLAA